MITGRARAELSIFFALSAAVILALFLGILESARTQAARLHLTIAANSSIDSLFSQYHKELWKEYRLLGLEQYAYDQLTDEMEEFIKPYFEADNWLSMELDAISLEEAVSLIEENGEIFEKEVLDYMGEGGIAALIWDLAEIEIFDLGMREGPGTEDIADLYDDHAEEAEKIEKLLSETASLAEKVSKAVGEASKAAGDCAGSIVITRLREAIGYMEDMPGLVEKYEAEATKLEKGLAASRLKLDAKRDSGEISDSTWAMLDEDISGYESYILEDGERRTEILGFKTKSSSDIEYFGDMIEKTEDIMEYIENYEPDEDEDDELDEEELYRPVKISLGSYVPISISGSYGIEDEEQLDRLISLKTFLEGELLELLLPEGVSVSSDALFSGESVSSSSGADFDEQRLSLLERVYVAEYMVSVFGYFGRHIYDQSTDKGSGGCEIEYILAGWENDTENLSAVLQKLFLLRAGMNLIYLYSDSSMRNEAKTLSMSICGAAAFTPLSMVVCFLIMSVWASAGAVVDLRTLLKGGRVPFMHERGTYSPSLSNLLSIMDTGMGAAEERDSEEGLTYRQYLEIFLFFGMGSGFEYRAMDMIEMNLRKGQSDFRLSRLIYSAEATVSVNAGHLFSKLSLAEAFMGKLDDYQMKVSTSYSY